MSRIWKVTAFTSFILISALVILGFAEKELSRRNNLNKIAQVHLERGIQLHQQKAYLPAKRMLLHALKADPGSWQAFFYLGAGNYELKRYSAAIPFLERALTLAPEEQEIYKMMGVVYYKLSKLDMARGYFTAYFELDPDEMDARGMVEMIAKLQRSTTLAAQEGNIYIVPMLLPSRWANLPS